MNHMHFAHSLKTASSWSYRRHHWSTSSSYCSVIMDCDGLLSACTEKSSLIKKFDKHWAIRISPPAQRLELVHFTPSVWRRTTHDKLGLPEEAGWNEVFLAQHKLPYSRPWLQLTLRTGSSANWPDSGLKPEKMIVSHFWTKCSHSLSQAKQVLRVCTTRTSRSGDLQCNVLKCIVT